MSELDLLDGELQHRLMQNAESYRLRLRPLNGAKREQELYKISQELATEQQAAQNCASVVLECFRPAIGSAAYKELIALQQAVSWDRERTRCMRLVANVTTRWGLPIVEHYGWQLCSRKYLESLWAAAKKYPDWHDAADHLNAVMIRRHDGNMRSGSSQSQFIGVVDDKCPPHSPITRVDLANICVWQKDKIVEIRGYRVSDLKTELALVEQWLSYKPKYLRFSTGLRVIDLPDSAQPMHLLAKDEFGIIVQETYGKKRTRISRGVPEDEDLPRKRVKLRGSIIGSTDDEVRRSAEGEPSESSIGDEESLGDADTTNASVWNGDSQPQDSTPKTSVVSSRRSTPSRERWDRSSRPDDAECTRINPCVTDLYYDSDEQVRDEAEAEDIPDETENEDGEENGEEDGDEDGEEDDSEDEDEVEDRGEEENGDNPDETLSTQALRDQSREQMTTLIDIRLSPAPLRSHDCPLCKGQCTAGWVPSNVSVKMREMLFNAFHEARDLVDLQANTHKSGRIQQAWMHRLHAASVYYSSGTLGSSECSMEEADVLYLDEDTFRDLSLKGRVWHQPMVIREAFKDLGLFDKERCVRDLKDLKSAKFEMRNSCNGELVTWTARRLAGQIDSIGTGSRPMYHKACNGLNMRAWADAEKPYLTMMPRYRLLKTLVDRIRMREDGGKETGVQQLDIAGCLHWNILGCKGAFSGAHVDALAGTWLRNLFGRKLWMFVPPDLMQPQDWTTLARDGDRWDPFDKARAVVLDQDDIFFMPPGFLIPHAVLTLDTCLMEGGMVWDEKNVVDVLECLCWIGDNQQATNEPIFYQQNEILQELQDLVQSDYSRFSGVSDKTSADLFAHALERAKSLHCECNGECSDWGRAQVKGLRVVRCPCWTAKRRCTPACGKSGSKHISSFRCLHEA